MQRSLGRHRDLRRGRIGAQAQVDAEHVAVNGDLGQQLDQLLRNAGEEHLVRQRPHAIGLAVLGEGENQVDVGGKIQLAAAELLVLKAAWKSDQGTAADEDYAMAKLYATETLARVTDHAVQIFGGMGLMEELPIERLWRDARVERIWDGTSEIQRHIISRSLLRPHEG